MRAWMDRGVLLLTYSFCDTALANADDMLQRLMRTVDTNGDGKIQYEGERKQPPRLRVNSLSLSLEGMSS